MAKSWEMVRGQRDQLLALETSSLVRIDFWKQLPARAGSEVLAGSVAVRMPSRISVERSTGTCLSVLAALGPMEFEPGEREAVALALEEMDRLGPPTKTRPPSLQRSFASCAPRAG